MGTRRTLGRRLRVLAWGLAGVGVLLAVLVAWRRGPEPAPPHPPPAAARPLETGPETARAPEAAAPPGALRDLRQALAERLQSEPLRPGESVLPELPPSAGLTPEEAEARARALAERLAGELALGEREALERELAALFRDHPENALRVFDPFLADWDPEDGHPLTHALALSQAPEVAHAALDAVASGRGREARMAALKVLDYMDPRRPEVRQRVLSLIGPQAEEEVVLGAMYALERPVDDPEAATSVVEALAPVSEHSDVEVRRRALITTGRWATDSDAVDRVARGLSDAEPLVRASSAYALGAARVRSDDATDALLDVARDPDESQIIRIHSCRSLGAMEVDAARARARADACAGLGAP